LPKVNRMLAKKMLLTQEKDRETRRRKGEDVAEPVDAAAAGASVRALFFYSSFFNNK